MSALITDRKIIKKLNDLAPINGPRLYEQVRDLLAKCVEWAPEKTEEFIEDGTYEFFRTLVAIHREFFKLNPFGDLFGEYVSDNELLSDRAGQFFTPINLAQMITDILNTVNTEEFNRILDPASGTGRFMLRTAKTYHEAGAGYNFLFTNIDIDPMMWTYTTMNAILHDIPSISIHGNSLTMEYWGAYLVVPTNTSHSGAPGIGLWYKLDPEKLMAEHRAMIESNRTPKGMERFVGKVKSRRREKPVKFGSIEPKQKKLFEDA